MSLAGSEKTSCEASHCSLEHVHEHPVHRHQERKPERQMADININMNIIPQEPVRQPVRVPITVPAPVVPVARPVQQPVPAVRQPSRRFSWSWSEPLTDEADDMTTCLCMTLLVLLIIGGLTFAGVRYHKEIKQFFSPSQAGSGIKEVRMTDAELEMMASKGETEKGLIPKLVRFKGRNYWIIPTGAEIKASDQKDRVGDDDVSFEPVHPVKSPKVRLPDEKTKVPQTNDSDDPQERQDAEPQKDKEDPMVDVGDNKDLVSSNQV